jgi:hypothetical protein
MLLLTKTLKQNKEEQNKLNQNKISHLFKKLPLKDNLLIKNQCINLKNLKITIIKIMELQIYLDKKYNKINKFNNHRQIFSSRKMLLLIKLRLTHRFN